MPPRYNLPHIDISALSSDHEYVGEQGFGSSAVREREAHGQRLQNELRVALEAADVSRPTDTRIAPPTGSFVEVELRRNTPPDALDLKKQDIRGSAAKLTDANTRTIALYVPTMPAPYSSTFLVTI